MVKRLLILLFLTIPFGVWACAPLVEPCVVDHSCPDGAPTRTPRADSPGVWAAPAAQTPVANSQDPYQGLYGSQTAVGLYQDELDRAQTELQMQLMRDAATSTAGAQMTATSVAGVQATSAAGTQVAAIQIAQTAQAAGTQTAFPLTQVSVQSTLEVQAVRATMAKVQAVVWPILIAVAVIAFGTLGWVWLRKFIAARHLQASQIKPDDAGRYAAVPEDAIPGKSKRIVNPNLMHRAVHDPAVADDLTTQQALANTHDQRRLEMVRSVSGSPRLAAALLKAEQNNTPPEPTEEMPMLPRINLPESNLLNQWDGKLLPYGADESQKLLTVDPARHPHLMISGMTGAGKTRYMIRTIMAGALASGWQVIVIGKLSDYIPFDNHPNATLIGANPRTESQKYIQMLRAASDQMSLRDKFLVERKISTWDRYGGPQTLIILDDYSGAMMMMPKKDADQALNWALAIAMDGRKYGLNLLLGLQRPSWKCISTDLRSQMSRIAMRVSSAHESRLVLDEEGAELLQDRHFLERLEDGGILNHGAAFALSDQETSGFLASRPAQPVGQADWIDAVSTTVEPEVAAENQVPDDDQKIRTVLIRMIQEDNVSLRQVEREVWGKVRGGQYYEQVSKIYKDLRQQGATTTRSVPDSGAIAA